MLGRVPHGRQRLAYVRQLGVLNLNQVYNLTSYYDKLLTLIDNLRLVIEFVSPILPNLRHVYPPLRNPILINSAPIIRFSATFDFLS